MSIYYIDTNVFITLADTKDPSSLQVYHFIEFCRKNKIELVTSVETIQEIIHVLKNKRRLKEGITLASRVMKLVDEVLSVDKDIISIYLDIISRQVSFQSRDYIHFACCKANSLSTFVTYDRDLKKYKDLDVRTPEEFIN